MPYRRILALIWLLSLLIGSLSAHSVAGAAGHADLLTELAEDSTEPLVVRADSGERLPSFVTGRIPVAEFSSSQTPRNRGWDFWSAYGKVFGVSEPRAELAPRSIERDGLGMTHLTYDQRHAGLPVFGRQLLLHLDGDAVTVVNGEFTPDIDLSTEPAVSAADARAAARRSVPARRVLPGGPPAELLVHVDEAERARLAWRVTVGSRRPLGVWQAFVNARTGQTITQFNDLHTVRNRSIHTNANDPDCNAGVAPQCVLPGMVVRTEGQAATADATVNDNYDRLGTVYDYYLGTFGRDSYDGLGHIIRSTVHFGSNHNQAFWCTDACAAVFGNPSDGEQVAFGDGNGVVFSSLARDIDVVAHELTHGVVSSEANLTPQIQSGALNESYADVFAAMVDTDNWLIGEDSFSPGIPGDAIRDMANPAASGGGSQPDHMSVYRETVYDSGGIHINSGIPNRAAYLTSEGPGYGIGRASTQQIYYRALTTYLTPSSDFRDNLNALLQSADDLFPGTAEMAAVARANATVGIANPPAVTFPNGGEALPGGSARTITWTTNDNAVPFRVSYLQDAGTTTYSQGFAGAGLPAEFTTSGNANWLVDGGDPSPGGGFNVRSGAIGDNGRSDLSMNVRLAAAGQVNFRIRVQSQANADFFSFHIDGKQWGGASGDIAWGTVAAPLSAGTHTLTWVYEKNPSGAAPGDLARVDDIAVSNVQNATPTVINASTAPGATSQAWTTPGTSGSNFRVRVEALGGVAAWYSTDESNATFTIDNDPPETTITGGPAGPTNDNTPTFTFTSDESGSTFQCRVFQGLPPAFGPCSGPGNSHTTGVLTDGAYTFEVRATDAAGNEDTTATSFTVDTDPPDTTITAGPTGTTPDTTPTFEFTSDEGGSTFQCRVVPAGFASCTSPHTTSPLSEGSRTFEVRATDAASNVDGSPATRSFTVDVPEPPPTVSIGDAKKKEADKGKKMMSFTVSLSRAATSPVTVSFATANGTARAPKDFTATSGSLTFAPGTTSQVVKVPIKGDTKDEKHEKFSVLLSGPSGATVGDGTGVGKIRDDD
jgi:bacillolysin